MVAALQRDGAVIVEASCRPTCWPASTPRSSRSWRPRPAASPTCSTRSSRGSTAARPSPSPASPASRASSPPRCSPTRCTGRCATRSCCRTARATASTSPRCSTGARDPSSSWCTATRRRGRTCSNPHPEVQVASVIALEDFTAANGATRVVPGQPPLAARPRGRARRAGGRRDAGRLGRGLPRIDDPRRRRQHHHRRAAPRDARQLLPRVAAHRGEPVPRHAARDGPVAAAPSRRRCSATPSTTAWPSAAGTSARSSCRTRWSSSPTASSDASAGAAGARPPAGQRRPARSGRVGCASCPTVVAGVGRIDGACGSARRTAAARPATSWRRRMQTGRAVRAQGGDAARRRRAVAFDRSVLVHELAAGRGCAALLAHDRDGAGDAARAARPQPRRPRPAAAGAALDGRDHACARSGSRSTPTSSCRAAPSTPTARRRHRLDVGAARAAVPAGA